MLKSCAKACKKNICDKPLFRNVLEFRPLMGVSWNTRPDIFEKIFLQKPPSQMFDWVLNTSLGWVISRWLIKENSAFTLLPIEVTLEYHPKFPVFRIFLMDSSYLNLQEMQINIAIGRFFTKVKNLLWRFQNVAKHLPSRQLYTQS